MARGDLELSFVTKITSPKNLLKALAVVIFGFVPLLGASGCARDSATRNSISCHTLQIRDPDATPPLSSDDSTLPSYGHSRWTDATRTGASAGLGLRGERERCERRRGGWVANLRRVTADGIACR